ncbi:MAG: 50S rRNA methyltransferase [Denitrovibrio sp.]|nr:MAG: 50S rRNA methyltransferase [Denitrovibrio sp.]
MLLKILMGSKLKEPEIKNLTDRYVKMASGFMPVQVVEDTGKKKQSFGKGLLVGMDPEGKQFTSEEFARWIEKRVETYGDITFYIGEAEGLPKDVRAEAKEFISLSGMVMAHRISLVVLAEQIYRALTIINGHPYHK